MVHYTSIRIFAHIILKYVYSGPHPRLPKFDQPIYYLLYMFKVNSENVKNYNAKAKGVLIKFWLSCDKAT